MRFLIFFLVSFQLYAAPSVNIKTQKYEAFPSSVENLMTSIDAVSPIREKGKIYHGYTKTNIKWRFWWDKLEGYCKLNKVTSTVDIIYILPSINKTRVSAEVFDVWGEYYSALVEHEEGHGQIAIDTANEIEANLLRMPAVENCEILNKKANAKGYNLLKKSKLKHARYDKKTHHGRTQGVNVDAYLQ